MTTEADGVAFVRKAVEEVGRWSTKPVTASLSGTFTWPTLDDDVDLSGAAVHSPDFVQLHPYAGPDGGNLDSWILTNVSSPLAVYSKPVFIGESGLNTDLPTLGAASIVMDPDAPTGIRQAIWAAAVSGAASARLLWFEDGYDVFSCADPADLIPCDPANELNLRTTYANASSPVKTFLSGVDYSRFAPITLVPGSVAVYGATLGNNDRAIGWVRDVASVAPDWPQNFVTGATVTVELPGAWDDWRVDFFHTTNGIATGAYLYAQQDANGDITFTLPDFTGSIAFKITGMAALTVAIDIRPFSAANQINPNAAGAFPVAILTMDPLAFDATTIDAGSIEFGPGEAPALTSRVGDVDGNTHDDLVVAIRKRSTDLTCAEDVDNGGVARLTGRTTEGRSFAGEDYVEVLGLGCPP